jgi:predicted small lipoprotein YifL
MLSRPAYLALLAACALSLNACGTKGPLTLPGEAPAAAKKQPRQTPARTAGDNNSTPTTPASR